MLIGRRFDQQGNASSESLKQVQCFVRKDVHLMRTRKILVGVVLLSSALSMLPAAVAWAGMFDGATFSVQDRGFGGHKGGQDKRQFREARPAQFVPPDKGRARGQLTEDERRQLHRDLDKANREIYGGNRGR
jgi:hypothetical protein